MGTLTIESLSSLVAAFSYGFKFTKRPVPEISSAWDLIGGVLVEPIETIERVTMNGFLLAIDIGFEPSGLNMVCPG